MACIKPPEIAQSVLFAYLDGEADEEVADHLEACNHCRDRAERLRVLERKLRAGLYRVDCPSALELGRFHIHALPEDESGRIGIHLQSCPHCQGELEVLTEYLSNLDSGVLLASKKPPRVRVARLRDALGSIEIPAPAVQRGDMGEPILYEADEIRISLSIGKSMEDPEKRTLFGLMTGTELRGWVVFAIHAGSEVARVGVDRHGNFVISSLEPVEYELIFEHENDQLKVESLDLGD